MTDSHSASIVTSAPAAQPTGQDRETAEQALSCADPLSSPSQIRMVLKNSVAQALASVRAEAEQRKEAEAAALREALEKADLLLNARGSSFMPAHLTKRGNQMTLHDCTSEEFGAVRIAISEALSSTTTGAQLLREAQAFRKCSRSDHQYTTHPTYTGPHCCVCRMREEMHVEAAQSTEEGK